ncbi:MAG: flavodoxin family protein [Deltaproteobacteria bacterium]|jgi:multimeric flavodoxin WrbA|nr:flavodoxin family protein [Deltaproteobacteria bacterium]
MATKRLVLHDLPGETFERLAAGSGVTEFNALPRVANCVGCFKCWYKTPGTCVTKDRAGVFPKLLAEHDEILIVSRLVFGGFSPEVKAVLERSLPFVLPFMSIRDGKTAHERRRRNVFVLKTAFYGEGSGETVCLAGRMTLANSFNLGAERHESRYFPDAGTAELREFMES